MNLESFDEQPFEAPDHKGAGGDGQIFDDEVRRLLGRNFSAYVEREIAIEGCPLPEGLNSDRPDSKAPTEPERDSSETE